MTVPSTWQEDFYKFRQIFLMRWFLPNAYRILFQEWSSLKFASEIRFQFWYPLPLFFQWSCASDFQNFSCETVYSFCWYAHLQSADRCWTLHMDSRFILLHIVSFWVKVTKVASSYSEPLAHFSFHLRFITSFVSFEKLAKVKRGKETFHSLQISLLLRIDWSWRV